jgi:hypothetical protein
MTEIEIVQAVMDNRAVFSSLSIGYGMLSLNLILAAYLFRNLPVVFRAVLTIIFLWFILNSVMRVLVTEADYLSLITYASELADQNVSPLLEKMIATRGMVPGQSATVPNWNYFGALATLLHIGITIYLLLFAKWREE